MPPALASGHLSDDEFLDAFHSCSLKAAEFRNADHFRLAWLHLHREPFDTALENVCTGLQAFAASRNSDRYHATITIAWMHLLATHHESTFEEFLTANADRLNQNLLHRFWTPELLAGAEAKATWVPPDIRNLP